MILFDFKCSHCGNKFERLVHKDIHKAQCAGCNYDADRMVSAPRLALDPISGDFPSATRQWEKKHEQMGKQGAAITREQAFYNDKS